MQPTIAYIDVEISIGISILVQSRFCFREFPKAKFEFPKAKFEFPKAKFEFPKAKFHCHIQG